MAASSHVITMAMLSALMCAPELEPPEDYLLMRCGVTKK